MHYTTQYETDYQRKKRKAEQLIPFVTLMFIIFLIAAWFTW